MSRIIDFFEQFWDVLGEMSPYLLFGFIIAGFLSVWIPRQWVETHLGGRSLLASLKAAAIGVPLPVCSCGVIPLAASLRKNGAGKGPTSAFLISTPQTGADSILATWSLLGGVYAIFRPFAALFSGLIGGLLTSWLDGDDPHPPIERKSKCTCESQTSEKYASSEADSRHDESNCCNEKADHDEIKPSCCAAAPSPCPVHGKAGAKILQALKYGLRTLPNDLAFSLLIGLIVSALIGIIVPKNFFADQLSNPAAQMGLMLLLGIPMYVCSTASIPIAASLVIHAGVSPGAALVFLMTGPATNAATIATLWKMLGRRSTIIYIFSVAGSAVIAGFLLNGLFNWSGYQPKLGEMSMLPDWVKHTAGAVLLALLIPGVCAAVRRKHKAH